MCPQTVLKSIVECLKSPRGRRKHSCFSVHVVLIAFLRISHPVSPNKSETSPDGTIETHVSGMSSASRMCAPSAMLCACRQLVASTAAHSWTVFFSPRSLGRGAALCQGWDGPPPDTYVFAHIFCRTATATCPHATAGDILRHLANFIRLCKEESGQHSLKSNNQQVERRHKDMKCPSSLLRFPSYTMVCALLLLEHGNSFWPC